MDELEINLTGKGKSSVRSYLKIIACFNNITPAQLEVIAAFVEIYHEQSQITKDSGVWGYVFSPISRKNISKKLNKSIVNINNVIMELKKKKLIVDKETHLEIKKIFLYNPKTLIFKL